MIRFPVISPPTPPPNADPRYLRPWFERLTQSLQSVVEAVRNLEIPEKTPIFKKITGVPDGSAEGQILHWDDTNKAWKVSVVGTLTDGDYLKWDGTNKKWIKVTLTTQTVVTDMQYDSSSHVVQKKTISLTIAAKGSESSWTTITGGQAAEET